MSLGIAIRVSGEGAEIPGRVRAAIAPARLNPVIGRAAVNTITAHLRRLNRERPNALGGKRTNYYATAARGTSFALVGDNEVVVSIAQRGIRQRVFGGTLRPRAAKFLTIPAIPEAYGKRAREIPGLEFALLGGKPALVRPVAGGEPEVVFWLRRSVTQRPDPTVLPEAATLRADIVRAVESTVARAVRRAGPGQPPATA